MPSEVREVRGIPLWLLREYLVEAGGTAEPEGVVRGDAWTVRLAQIEDYRVGSLRVGQIRVELEGTDEGFARLKAILEPKLLRAGG